MQPQRSEKGHYRAVTPGSYDAIRLVYSAMNVEDPPYRTIEISTIHMFSDRPYITDLTAEPVNANNAALRWDPVPGAEKYIVRYGPELRNYTNTVELMPGDLQPGNRWIIPNVSKEQVMHVLVAPVVNGQIGNYSADRSVLITDALTFPQGTRFSLDYDGGGRSFASSIGDGNINNTWGSSTYYKQKKLTYLLDFSAPLYITSLQMLAAVPRSTSVNYTVHGWKDGKKSMIGQQSYELAKKPGPTVLEPLQVKPGWYDRISILAESADGNELYEILWRSTNQGVQGIQAVGGDGQISVRWNPLENADYYVIDYESLFFPDKGSIQVPVDASAGYVLSELLNGQKYNVTVSAHVNGSMTNPSDTAVAAVSAPAIGQPVPAGTILSGTGKYDWDIGYATDGNMSSAYQMHSGHSMGLLFPKAVDLTAVQITSYLHESYGYNEQKFTIYGLQGKQWIRIGSDKLQPINVTQQFGYTVMNKDLLLEDPIAVTPGKYEGLMITTEEVIDGFFLLNFEIGDIKLVYGPNNDVNGNSVIDDTYGAATVSGNTYIQ
ncbi:fibronectin type III domain-containing protein [Paenibacillus wulumuqiensis]|uniref:fibronectin type III domain-containing protein n=1 Tax=Paenibacillus wulumuqiensis TaxID=1567107 RepID=UPI0006194F09|nr:fibronectin type III domain-containing protein [Paenibacillus wulumuqiensis]